MLLSKCRLHAHYIINHIGFLFNIQILGLTELNNLDAGPSNLHS